MLVNERYVHGGMHDNDEYIDMSVNINPYGTPEPVVKAMQQAVYEVFRYPDALCTDLTAKISRMYDLPTDYIICGNGADELIYNYAAVLGRDARVLIYAPAFAEYERALQAYGASVEYYVIQEQCGFKMQMSDIDEETIASVDAVFICMPSNPAGQLIDREVLEKLIDVCNSNSTRCFLDICFYELTGGYDSHYITSLVNQYNNLCVLSAFTKTYAIPGVRLGYMLCSDTGLISDISARQQCWNVSVIAQRAGAACLDCGDYVAASREYIAKEREYIYNKLSELVTRVYRSDANYVMFYDENIDCGMLDEYMIRIRDCSDYVGLGRGYYRVCVGNHECNEKLIAALADIKEKRCGHGKR